MIKAEASFAGRHSRVGSRTHVRIGSLSTRHAKSASTSTVRSTKGYTRLDRTSLDESFSDEEKGNPNGTAVSPASEFSGLPLPAGKSRHSWIPNFRRTENDLNSRIEKDEPPARGKARRRCGLSVILTLTIIAISLGTAVVWTISQTFESDDATSLTGTLSELWSNLVHPNAAQNTSVLPLTGLSSSTGTSSEMVPAIVTTSTAASQPTRVLQENKVVLLTPGSTPNTALAAVQTDVKSSVASTAAAQYLDTRPVIRKAPVSAFALELAKKQHRQIDVHDVKYMTYLPHSGFHNQRIELQNALLLAHMLNRTLLLPPLRLGFALGWQTKELLYESTVLTDKNTLRKKCEKFVTELEWRKDHPEAKTYTPLETAPELVSSNKGSEIRPMSKGQMSACKEYISYTQVEWDFIADVRARVESQLPLVDRWNSSNAWYTTSIAKGGLGLKPSEVEYFTDEARYDLYFVGDTHSPPRNTDKDWKRRFDIEQLMSPPYIEKRLFDFGSMYGSARVTPTEPRDIDFARQVGKSLVFRIPLLEPIAAQISSMMGGMSNYIGLHLRIGDGVFFRHSDQFMREVFFALCESTLGLSKETTEKLYTQGKVKVDMLSNAHEKRSHEASYDLTEGLTPDDLLPNEPSSPNRRRLLKRARPSPKRLSSALTCRGELHKDPELLPLNTPVYIATDSHHPSSDAVLAPFFHALPCAFVLGDFQGSEYNSAPLAAFASLQNVRNKLDGVKMAPFLYPFLEAMIVARGYTVVGTPGSTFSGFSSGVLHRTYKHEAKQTKSHLQSRSH